MRQRQMRQPRLAEMVSDDLREEILAGRLRQGESLPRQEDLMARFNVSGPSVREALRILETEGLVTVRRGNVGGGTVHLPTSARVAYTLALVLEAEQAPLADLGSAVIELEPICAALCAGREDRAESLVPALREVLAEQREMTDDAPAFNEAARRFHEVLVAGCGNATLSLVVGGLEQVWSRHEEEWVREAAAAGSRPAREAFDAGLRDHEKLVDAIEAGDAARASRIAGRHLDATQRYTGREDAARRVRSRLVR